MQQVVSNSTPDFHRQVLAVNRVEQLLREVAAALDAAGVAYAIIGGNAVAAWVASVDAGAVRATKDVDLLVRRGEYDAVAAALAPLGLAPLEVLGVPRFVASANPNPRTNVHVVFASERIKGHYTTPAPDPADAVRAADGYAVLALPQLVAMKLESFRDIDRVHLRDLRDVGLVTPELLAGLPDALRTRYAELQD